MIWRACRNRLLSPTRVSASLGLEWERGIYIFNMFPRDGDATSGQVHRTEEVLLRGFPCLSPYCCLWSFQAMVYACQKSLSESGIQVVRGVCLTLWSQERRQVQSTRKQELFGRFLTLAFFVLSAFLAVLMGQFAFGPLASRDV